MKRVLFATLLVFLIASWTVRATWSPYYTENMASPNWSNWTVQDPYGTSNVPLEIAVQNYGGYSGVGGFGTMMYNHAGTSGADISMTVRIAPSTSTIFSMLFLANSTSPWSTGGSYGWLMITNTGTVVLDQAINSSFTQLGSASSNIHDNSTVRVVAGYTYGSEWGVAVYVDNALVLAVPYTVAGGNYNGVGIQQVDAPSDGDVIASVSLANLVTTPPTAIPSTSIGVTTGYNYIDLQWPAASDPNGPGVYEYVVARNGQTLCVTQSLACSDTTVLPNTAYTYTVSAEDYYFNYASTNISATAPAVPTNPPFPSTTPDGQRLGVQTTGAYWGASPETIDVRSGNLNFGVPLIHAQGRGGWSVNFNLIYNSQVWRNSSGGVSVFNPDVGYGFGFRLMAGSITPVWNPAGLGAAYYIFTDSTGAEYRLDQDSGNIWSSKQSIYVWFDANANILHFRDGSFWNLGCISATGEADSGVMYPTLMEDTNGNQVLIRYFTGLNGSWTNSSARIWEIEDVRAVQGFAGAYYSYVFGYNSDTPAHLTSITSTMGTGENYTFSYSSGTLYDPFVNGSYGTVKELSQATVSNIGTYHQFTYNSSGEITKIQLPYKGYLGYSYLTTTYSGPSGTKSYREVANRYLSKDGSTQTTYPFTKDVNPSADVHSYATLDDPGGVGEKHWTFAATGSNEGLATQYQGKDLSAGEVKTQNDLTWTQDSTGNSYIGTNLTTTDPGQSYQVQTQTIQTLDIYGNVTQVQDYNYGNLTTPARTSTYTYLNNAGYTPYYILNRLLTATVTDGTNTIYPATITYDQYSLASQSGLREWDTLYSSRSARGNPTTSVTPTTNQSMTYDVAGNAATVTVNGVTSNVSTTSATNFAAPSAMNVGSLTQAMSYNSFLGLTNDTGPNGTSVSLGYDANARPTSVTSPFGATTTTTYADTASPPYSTTTVNGRWTTTYLDGLGRTLNVQTGNSSGTLSVAESVYGSCGCSPAGKLIQQAVPHIPGATPAYTTYTYDGIGRTVTVLKPDGASTTSYLYQGNTVTVTDPAGKWKTFTMDAFGNLVSVSEPNPSGGANYVTTYTYDLFNHLTGVVMTRGTVTQTRSFIYGGGGYLLSATNPENGTVTYTYSSTYPGKVATRVDAKGQKTAYTYDSYARLTKVQRYPTQNGAEDTCQQEDYYYDSNPFDGGTYSNYMSGRLAAIQYWGGNIGSGCSTTFQEWYNYGVPGAAIGKKLRVTRTLSEIQSPGSQVMNVDLNGAFTYDNEGRMINEGYPTDNAGTTASLGFGFDSMGRIYNLTDELASQQIIQSATYGPSNELTQITGGSYGGAWGTETRTYNVMKQMTQLTSNGVSMTYNYSSSQNNGKIVSDTNGSYTYDSLNRLATFVGSGANQTFTYDGFGNLASIAGTQANTITYNPATNQGYCADSNGNSTEALCAGGYYGNTYDIENRIVQTGTAGGNFHYSYAPGNKRVWRGDGITTDEVTFWSPNGQKLGTYALTTTAGTYTNAQFVGPFFYATQTDANYYFGGKLIKNARGWVYSDRLGSIGKYLPYGQDNGSGNPANGTEKFTGYQRDAESGNDYADQRYQSPGTGRFLTADRTSGTPADPGAWNKYAYTGGDPINRVDPGGTSYFQDCIQDGDCDAAFDDPLVALTIQNASYDPNSPCFGESLADVSDSCLAALFGPGLFQVQQAPLPSCSISVASSGMPRDGQNFVGLVPYSPTTNQLGSYNTIGRSGLAQQFQGWFFAVQIQANLTGDTNPSDWVATQTVSTSGTIQMRSANGTVSNYSGAIATHDDSPAQFAINANITGVFDWLDAPGFPQSNLIAGAGRIVAATLTDTFTSTLRNIATGATCSVSWSVTLTVKAGVGKMTFGP